MKKFLFGALIIGVSAIALFLYGADHIDAPAVGSLSNGSSAEDITDYYAFESPSNSDNYVFVCNVRGLTAPSATSSATFKDDVMYEFNIDNDADNIEDVVIQTIVRGDKVITFGAVPTSDTGLESKIQVGNKLEVDITPYGSLANVAEANGVKIFAGPRDDPFFMDFFRFVDIVNGAGSALGLDVPPPANGEAYATSFANDGTDTFAGTNVLSIVVEVPKS